jgi:uncharacterized protein
MAKAHFKLLKSTNNQFYFVLRAANNEVILTSETYTEKASALNGISSVKENAPQDARYDRLDSAKTEPYFVLKAGNNKVIGTSEMYSSKQARDGGISAVKAAAPGAEMVDET